ncbi:MAG: glycosyltransferase [Candidatus Sericytochromatia bacterium]
MTIVKYFKETEFRKDKPLISVVIPCYNYGKYLNDSVESVINQKKFSNFEIIIVNDGSNDNTSEIAINLINKYNEIDIKLFETENQGVSATRNFGLSKSRGEWLLSLDADDMFKENFFDSCFEIVNKNKEINLIFSNLEGLGGPPNWGWKPTEYSFENLAFQNTFPYSSLHKRDLFEKTDGYNSDIPWGAEDWEYWIRCAKEGLKPERLKDSFFIYRVNHSNDNLSLTMSKNYDYVIAILRTLHPDVYDIRDLTISHNIIENMNEDTLNQLLKKIKSPYKHSNIYFWLGLYFLKKEDFELSLDYLNKSAQNVSEYDWQPFIKLAELYKKIGDFKKSNEFFKENKIRKEKSLEQKKSLPW